MKNRLIMKYVYLLTLLFLLTVSVSAQTSSDTNVLTVLYKKWEKKVRSTSGGVSLGGNSSDPFAVNRQATQANNAQREYLRDRVQRESTGQPTNPPPGETFGRGVKAGDMPRGGSYGNYATSYIYQIKVQNKGTKSIKKVTWEYVFYDPATNQEVGRQEFISFTNLKPGKSANLVEKLYLPPTGKHNVTGSKKKLSKLYNEQILIKYVGYEDDTSWAEDSN